MTMGYGWTPKWTRMRDEETWIEPPDLLEPDIAVFKDYVKDRYSKEQQQELYEWLYNTCGCRMFK